MPEAYRRATSPGRARQGREWQDRLSDRHGPVETVGVLLIVAAVPFLATAHLTLEVVAATPAAAIGTVHPGLITAIAHGMFAFGIPRVGATTAVPLPVIEPVTALPSPQ